MRLQKPIKHRAIYTYDFVTLSTQPYHPITFFKFSRDPTASDNSAHRLLAIRICTASLRFNLPFTHRVFPKFRDHRRRLDIDGLLQRAERRCSLFEADLFEGFTLKIVNAVKSNPRLWKNTAIFITFDEGGGYYDSGYVQPLDFFGDGTRVPLMVVSPYSIGGHISHEYADHVSILKFIERNWSISPVTQRSRDNFPDPVTAPGNPYVPENTRPLAIYSACSLSRTGNQEV